MVSNMTKKSKNCQTKVKELLQGTDLQQNLSVNIKGLSSTPIYLFPETKE